MVVDGYGAVEEDTARTGGGRVRKRCLERTRIIDLSATRIRDLE